VKIAAIIVNYNGISDTLECIESLEKSSLGGNNLEIYVVDNNSSDGSKLTLGKLTKIRFIQSEKNVGFSAGNNLAIKQALDREVDIVILINNDTYVDKNLLKKLAASSDRADIASPKILFAKGYEFHKKRYKKSDLGKIIWYAGGNIDKKNIVGKHIGVDEIDKGQYDINKTTDYATGACMMIKREVLEKIGYFDEKYFLYLEDMDFCHRANDKGFKIIYEPNGIVWHKNAGSIGGSGSRKQDYYFTKSRLIFSIKHLGLRTTLALLKEIIFKSKSNIRKRALLDIMRGNFSEAKNI